MDAVKARSNGAATADCYSNEGMVKVFSRTVTVQTNERTELVNLSDQVRAFADETGIRDGYIKVSSLHTTAGLFINEWQDALLNDIKMMVDRVVPRESYYYHNDPEYSDCDRHNADSHLKNVVFGLTLSVPVDQGKLVLGRWQSVILAEFDGPNERKVFLQAFGI
ncbi:MAG TPA: secondary thiamine-phosphate synthase enzyme YjbQ [Blastocatellia bacterium]|nr:secondary thiamine-phosphate synthase enzyme YjbQ [Blastocatellia bacterium]